MSGAAMARAASTALELVVGGAQLRKAGPLCAICSHGKRNRCGQLVRLELLDDPGARAVRFVRICDGAIVVLAVPVVKPADRSLTDDRP